MSRLDAACLYWEEMLMKAIRERDWIKVQWRQANLDRVRGLRAKGAL